MKRIVKASQESDKFGDLYDGGDLHSNGSIYTQIDKILDKYGSQDELVTTVFERASADDQAKLMQLAQQLRAEARATMTRDQLDQKFQELQRRSERDATSQYEDGYFDAMCDMAEAFGLDLG